MHFVLMAVPAKLYGRSHPAHKACKDGLSYGSRTLWVSRVEGVQGFLTRSWLKRFQTSKVLKNVKGPRASGFQRLKSFKGLRVSGHRGNDPQSIPRA